MNSQRKSSQVVLEARPEVIKDNYCCFILEVFNDVAADEPGAACDKYFHCCLDCISLDCFV